MILNRKAKYDYHFLLEFEAGMILTGTEVKSLRLGNASISESFIFMKGNKLFVKGMNISEYKGGDFGQHDPIRERELLLNKKELRDISKELNDNGTTIVPLSVYMKNGKFKMKIAVVKGKKNYDKRNSIKDRDNKRELDRKYKV